jgi:hypothetical protein
LLDAMLNGRRPVDLLLGRPESVYDVHLREGNGFDGIISFPWRILSAAEEGEPCDQECRQDPNGMFHASSAAKVFSATFGKSPVSRRFARPPGGYQESELKARKKRLYSRAQMTTSDSHEWH